MSALVEFLLARIAEDEAAADRASSFSGTETFQNDNYGHLTVQPGRVLRECEAKRRIVDEHGKVDPCDAHDAAFETIPCDTLRHLASVYADHPDYREEWKP